MKKPHVLPHASKPPLLVSKNVPSPSLTHSQLLARLKSESKYKTTKGGGVRARSLAHNTLRGRRACWSSGMGLGKS